MDRHRARVAVGAVVTAAMLVFGCAQDEGGRCEINSDCDDGLMCEKGVGYNGTCVKVGTTRSDASPDVVTATDLTVDRSASLDASKLDQSGPPADGASDVFVLDAAADASSALDAARDATGDAAADGASLDQVSDRPVGDAGAGDAADAAAG